MKNKLLFFILLGISVICSGQNKSDSSAMGYFTVRVYWVLEYEVPTACPDAGKKDEFGRVSQMSCLVYHFKIVLDTLSKSFTDRKKANKFYLNCQKQSDIREAWFMYKKWKRPEPVYYNLSDTITRYLPSTFGTGLNNSLIK